MNRYVLTEDVKREYSPIIEEVVKRIEEVDFENAEDYIEHDFSDTKLNPYTLCEILRDLGYEKEDQEENGWQLDFWITMTKKGCRPVLVTGCGMTFELKLGEVEC